MKTVFSLVYVESSRGTSDLLGAVNGPYLFDSKESAQEKLLDYVRNRIAEACPDALSEDAASWGIDVLQYTEDSDEPMTSEEVYTLLLDESEKLNFEALVDWYSRITNDELTSFGYKIEELSTTSFVDEVKKCDAIEINGHFLRQFYVASDHELGLGSEDGVFIDASITTDDMEYYEYYIFTEEAKQAKYEPNGDYWKVGDMEVRVIKFQA